MSFECFCTPSTLCSGCQTLMVECLNHRPPNSERVSPSSKLSFSSLFASQGPLLAPQESCERICIQQQMPHSRQNGQTSRMVSKPTVAQLQEMSTMQPSIPYVPGNCAKRVIQYMHQLHRNANASIEFWREVVAEFFAPGAKKRWCFSLCKNRPKQSAPFAQRTWQCQICKQNPGCGYEVTAEVLPTLSRLSYETGILQEILYIDIPSEHQKVPGEIAVHYDKATVELVYQNLRIAHDGHLCIVFTPDLKICSWDFCIRNIEQFISGRTLVPQVNDLRYLSWKYYDAQDSTSPILQSRELKRHSDKLAKTAHGFQKALNLPPVTDVGYTRKFLRNVEISEVLTCMGDLIDHSIATGMGPRMSLAILGGSSSQDRVPDSNRTQNRPLVQKAPNGGGSRRTNARASRRPPVAYPSPPSSNSESSDSDWNPQKP